MHALSSHEHYLIDRIVFLSSTRLLCATHDDYLSYMSTGKWGKVLRVKIVCAKFSTYPNGSKHFSC